MGAFAALALSLASAIGGGFGSPVVELVGRSWEDRPIRAVVVGPPEASRRILVVGCIHGDECAGEGVTRRLVRAAAPHGAALWIVHDLNPDGAVLGVRQNARGVDLNRNFSSEWRRFGRRWDPQYSGPRPFSERETRVARRLILRVRPDVSIWYHQPQALVRAWGASVRAARRYAGVARVPYRSIRWPPGSAPNWQNHRFPGTASFVVELPPGRLDRRGAARHVRAVLALGPAPVTEISDRSRPSARRR
ncbi:MAG: DUF2817 domain-containing protein [Actinomycetota bacterium]|nr:DUF2817 domain-containing protein [Actinomycetota bacterium]